MAKVKGWQKKHGIKKKEIKFEAICGVFPDGTHCNIEYNELSKRYVLLSGADQGGDVVCSSVSLTSCKNRKINEEPIVWRQ